ncbi:MAG: hypothetical protein JW991_00440 [Candidatus Pacebacteria bacterium]|nr:hypothetical protein [Candidatus Paceibacterota bacterium]
MMLGEFAGFMKGNGSMSEGVNSINADWHRRLAEIYGPSGYMAESAAYPGVKQRLDIWVQKLIENGVFPSPDKGRRVTIVSVAANSGYLEMRLKERLGENYLVVAGDIADVPREFGSRAVPARFDAARLPFMQGSIDVLIDLLGAAWHEALADEREGNGGFFFKQIIARYCLHLRPGGLLIIDSDRVRGPVLSTAARMEKIGHSEQLAGFKGPQKIGWDTFRVYTKKEITD